ncbi:hypothetical protein BJ170DRAFT_579983 [Xylariales sp. AK1849]|nr:hypothetical protein BJ170DRAFT_579983 [Xylariales sp. AK1849]
MRAIQLLTFYAATVLAGDSIRNVIDYGLSRPQELLGPSANPICLDGFAGPVLNEIFDEQRTVADSLWPFSTPCARNGTREYCIYSNPDFAGGRGITIFTNAARAVDIAKSSAFTDPAVFGSLDKMNAAGSPRWRVEEVQGKGMGMIASQHLEVGDHIMSTTASVMIDYSVFSDVAEAQLLQMQVDGVNYLPPKHRATLMNLSTHDHADSYEAQVSKVLLTNSFDIQDTGIISKTEEEEEENFYTVFPEVSRLNHDCRPNADYYFDPETFAQHIHVIRPIVAGEEITISYIDPLQSRQSRLERLNHSWHFTCSCSLCTQDKHQTAASNARIKQIDELSSQLRDWEPSSQATPAMAELLISLYDQERLWSSIHEAYTYAAIEHNGAGEPWLATKYARLAIKHGLAAGGPANSDVIEMKALAKDPWEHWSWMMRTKRRMNWVSKVDE